MTESPRTIPLEDNLYTGEPRNTPDGRTPVRPQTVDRGTSPTPPPSPEPAQSERPTRRFERRPRTLANLRRTLFRGREDEGDEGVQRVVYMASLEKDLRISFDELPKD